MDVWWPRATRDPGNDAGQFTTGAFKGVLHTTESTTFTPARQEFADGNSWPHFTVSFEAGHFHAWQHVPIDRAARSLKHPKGTVETNHAHAIQIELVGFSAQARSLPAAYLSGLAHLMRWLEAQTGIRRRHPPFKPYPASFGLKNGVRMTDARWLAFNGWCGHQHVPNNDHGDPGAIDMDRLLRAAALAAIPPVATGCDRAGAPTAAEAKAIRQANGAGWWGVYIGGPCSAGSGWTPQRVRELGAAGFEFLPIYVGQQSAAICPHHHVATAAQGEADGHDAVRVMRSFGWRAGKKIPVCLDVEAGTFEHFGAAALDYTGAWVRTVRAAGYRPGVYSSAACLAALSGRPPAQLPAFVWVASWLHSSHVNPALDPKAAPGLSRQLWRGRQRAWQYLGHTRIPKAASEVDVSCSNLALAPRP